ncbi:MAG TPA: methyl-accepting chemotaxis protein [Terriglobales bacterium]|nr:methyl-accepting chemotaxis protein [Terriglobales bacterium]
MTIARKVYLGFGAILFMLVFLFALNIIVLRREHRAKAEAGAAIEAVQAVASVRYQMMQNRLYLRNYLLSGDTREVDNLTSGMKQLENALQHAASVAEPQRRALMRVGEMENDWFKNFASVLIEKRRQVDDGKLTVAELQINYLQLNPASWVSRSTGQLDEVGHSITQMAEESRKSDEAAASVASIVAYMGMLFALLLGGVIAYTTSRSITEPLSRVITVTREIGSSGDLDQKVEVEAQGEIGELARSFNNMVTYLKEMAAVSEAIAGGDLTVQVEPRSRRDTLALAFMKMTEGLRSLVRSVRDSAAQVAGGSNQVAEASEESAKISNQASSAIDEVTSTMHEMSVNVQNMVRTTQAQASNVSETSASIDQMVTSIQRVAETARVLLEISNRSRTEVKEGMGTMAKATDGLNRIHGAIQSSAAIISALDQRADDIGKIVEVIDDLAEQTNLLALNAAIEAARAGEHGLGFAVVADEVRKLAEKSAHSTKEISELVQSIQREARQAVSNMEQSTAMVQEGLSRGGELSTALTKISHVVSEVNKFAQEIGAATTEQSHGSAQIAKTTTRLNEITHEINSAVEEQAAGAQAVVRAMEKMRELMQQSTSGSAELAASAEQMSKMARALLDAMDRFALEASPLVGRSARTAAAASSGPARLAAVPRQGF